MTPELLPTRFDATLVFASFLISAIGAYAALSASDTVRRSSGTVSKTNALLAGIALGGVGVWSMHFLGMLAWDTGITLGYRPLETLASLVLAIAASALALGYLADAPTFSYRRLAIAGPLAGLGVAGMHYLGMGSMRFGGYLDWNVGLVLLSVLIAIAVATAALWLAFHARSRVQRLGASLAMAAAVCTMHYTGMAAADVLCTTTDRVARLPGLLYRNELELLVIVMAVGGALLVGVDSFVQWMQRQSRMIPGR